MSDRRDRSPERPRDRDRRDRDNNEDEENKDEEEEEEKKEEGEQEEQSRFESWRRRVSPDPPDVPFVSSLQDMPPFQYFDRPVTSLIPEQNEPVAMIPDQAPAVIVDPPAMEVQPEDDAENGPSFDDALSLPERRQRLAWSNLPFLTPQEEKDWNEFLSHTGIDPERILNIVYGRTNTFGARDEQGEPIAPGMNEPAEGPIFGGEKHPPLRDRVTGDIIPIDLWLSQHDPHWGSQRNRGYIGDIMEEIKQEFKQLQDEHARYGDISHRMYWQQWGPRRDPGNLMELIHEHHFSADAVTRGIDRIRRLYDSIGVEPPESLNELQTAPLLERTGDSPGRQLTNPLAISVPISPLAPPVHHSTTYGPFPMRMYSFPDWRPMPTQRFNRNSGTIVSNTGRMLPRPVRHAVNWDNNGRVIQDRVLPDMVMYPNNMVGHQDDEPTLYESGDRAQIENNRQLIRGRRSRMWGNRDLSVPVSLPYYEYANPYPDYTGSLPANQLPGYTLMRDRFPTRSIYNGLREQQWTRMLRETGPTLAPDDITRWELYSDAGGAFRQANRERLSPSSTTFADGLDLIPPLFTAAEHIYPNEGETAIPYGAAVEPPSMGIPYRFHWQEEEEDGKGTETKSGEKKEREVKEREVKEREPGLPEELERELEIPGLLSSPEEKELYNMRTELYRDAQEIQRRIEHEDFVDSLPIDSDGTWSRNRRNDRGLSAGALHVLRGRLAEAREGSHRERAPWYRRRPRHIAPPTRMSMYNSLIHSPHIVPAVDGFRQAYAAWNAPPVRNSGSSSF